MARVGMRSDYGTLAYRDHVPETALGQMRDIHQHAQAVHLFYDTPPEFRKTPASLSDIHAISQSIASVPRQPHHPHAQTEKEPE